jgi:hypothetical protein
MTDNSIFELLVVSCYLLTDNCSITPAKAAYLPAGRQVRRLVCYFVYFDFSTFNILFFAFGFSAGYPLGEDSVKSQTEK